MWKDFWKYLNIRKCATLALIVIFGYVSIKLIGYGITSSSTEIVLAGATGVSNMLSIAIGYYFGYNNPNANNKDNGDI